MVQTAVRQRERPQFLASYIALMSALMGGADQAPLPPEWRSVTELAYPFDLPQRRRVRVDYALSWMRLRHV